MFNITNILGKICISSFVFDSFHGLYSKLTPDYLVVSEDLFTFANQLSK